MDTVAALLDAGPGTSPGLGSVDGAALDRAALAAVVHRLAGRLRAAGIGAGDRIAIVAPNGPEMALAFLAATVTGCAAPLNPGYREEEFRFYLDDLGAKALVTRPGDAAAAHAAAGPGVVRIALTGEFPSLDFEVPAADLPRADAPGPDDVALVLHTSGTTARPKIVPLRQRNLVRSAANIASSLALGEGDRALNVMPLFHIHGLMAGLLAPLSSGGSVVATPGFDPFRFHGWVDELEPTYYTAVPTMHQMVLARADGPRETALRFVRSSSASLPPPVLEDLRNLFGVPVIEAYGMTEATHQMASNPLPPLPVKPASVGLATGIELAVLDGESRPLAPGERGEVGIRGTTVVDGYENNPAANSAAFTGGWFRTGDEGYLDGDGYLFLTGRLKELINRGGEKVSPVEVDAVLLRHPAVAQAVAFAIPHARLGEEVGAAVVLREGRRAGEKELRAHVAAHLAAFKVPRRILFVDEIPKGPTGKMQRLGLAERLGL